MFQIESKIAVVKKANPLRTNKKKTRQRRLPGLFF